VARMNVAFSDTLVNELRHLVPVRQRSEFVEAAVREKLDLLRQRRAVADPEREIRKLRRAWDRGLVEANSNG